MSKVRGKLTCLVINDLDAGIGRFGNTQVRGGEHIGVVVLGGGEGLAQDSSWNGVNGSPCSM
jgi:hypothetical protein